MLGPVPRASSEPRSEIPLVPGGMYALCIQYYQEGARFSAAPIAERPSLLDASEQDPVPETASRYATPRDPHRPRAADESNTRPRGVPAPRPGRAHRPLAEEGRFRQGHPAAADKGDLRNPAPHRALRYGPRLWPDPPGPTGANRVRTPAPDPGGRCSTGRVPRGGRRATRAHPSCSGQPGDGAVHQPVPDRDRSGVLLRYAAARYRSTSVPPAPG